MFSWFKREVNECRSWRCDRYCQGCKIERFNRDTNKYNVAPMPPSGDDYKTLCSAFRATRYPFPVGWDPDILGVYEIGAGEKDTRVKTEAGENKSPSLLYFGIQRTGINLFLQDGFRHYSDSNERIMLNNTSFQAVNNHQRAGTSCDCVRSCYDVIYVVVCEVPNASEAVVFARRQAEGRGKHPFEKHEGEFSLDDNSYFKDNQGRGLSRGLFPAKMDCAMLKGMKLCDVFSVDRELVRPVYLIAVRLPHNRW